MELRLGGQLSTIVPNNPNPPPSHMDVWIEIWDRGRSETEIDENIQDEKSDRAVATAKVRNGVIEKVVVLEEGRGYVDPVVFVRGSGPLYLDANNPWRIWRCLNMRETKTGELQICGHMERGFYPPEQCPGEVDSDFNATDETDETAVNNWWIRHNAPDHMCLEGGNYPADLHREAKFLSRVCQGKKTNFALVNDPYRTPYEDWVPWNAQLVPLMEGGKIKDIVVLDGGQMYAAMELAVAGSGTRVDLIPVFDEEGVNTEILFDDPDLYNVERDHIANPLGAGQGFVERPWSLDGRSTNSEIGNPRWYLFLDDAPIYGIDSPVELENGEFQSQALPHPMHQLIL